MDTGYLDFHTHVLPGVDDGSKDIEMTKEMLLKCYEQGVRTIVATSHNYPSEHKKQDNDARKELTAMVDKLAKEINENFNVLCGNEIYFRPSIIQELEDNHILSLDGSDYLLVEFHPEERYHQVYDAVKALIEYGYDVVIAHVERVNSVFWDDDHIAELLKLGCYFQANTEDYMGGFFDKSAKRLIKMTQNGQIHFLGSDCHNTTDRAPMMENCVNLLRKKISPERFDKLIYKNRDKFLAHKHL